MQHILNYKSLTYPGLRFLMQLIMFNCLIVYGIKTLVQVHYIVIMLYNEYVLFPGVTKMFLYLNKILIGVSR